jgi:FkbM family methyltransferase
VSTKPVFKTIEDLMCDNNITLSNDDKFYFIEKENKVIKISMSHKMYIKTLMRFFDIHFNAVKNNFIDGKFIVDFSSPKKHKIIGFDLFDIYCPSLAETLDTAKQYLDLANLKPGDTVLDLGAYSGLTTILFSQEVGEMGKVIAVEPDELNFTCLEQNIAQLQQNNNIFCLNAAVWNHTGVLEFSVEESMGSSAVSIVGNRGVSKSVNCYTIDDICSKYELRNVDFIKCDIEGAEAYIFDNDEFFSKFKPKIIIETHIVNGIFCDQICIDHLSKYGYKYKKVEQNGLELPLIEFTF